MLGYLLQEELGETSSPSCDEVAAVLFPRSLRWVRHEGRLLPLQYPALPIPIADVWLLRMPLVFVQPSEQFFLFWSLFNLDELYLQVWILLLCRLEHT